MTAQFERRLISGLAFVWPVALAVALSAQVHAQGSATAASNGTIAIAGDVTQAMTISLADLKTMPRTTVTIEEEDGKQTHYEGVLLGELLRRAGAPVGRDLMQNGVASYVKAIARDGFQAVFSLAELDPSFTSNDIIVADSVEGKPLVDSQGPLRIIAPKDKRGSRRVRMLERVEVVRLVK
jgi:hypothetical protein